MNDLSSEVGLLKRQVRDVQSVTGNVQHMLRKLVDGRASAFDRPGGLVARAATCAVLGHIQKCGSDAVARAHFATDRELDRLLTLKAAVSPASSTVATWAAELAQTVTVDLADRLIPESVFVRLRGLGTEYTLAGGTVIRAPTWAPTATGGFIAENAPIPVSRFTFGSVSLGPKKAANIISVSDELMTGSPSDVEATLRAILGESLGLMIDGIFLGSGAATTAAPAGLLNGVTPLTPSAATPAASAMIADVKALTAAIAPALRPVLIAGPVTAASLNLLAPTSSLTVLVAPALTTGTVIAVDASAFVSAMGVPAFRASQHATLHEEDTTPLALGTGAQGSGVLAVPMRGTFASDVTALRTIVPCDWALRRSGAVAVVAATW